jgi:hypothetical protein
MSDDQNKKICEKLDALEQNQKDNATKFFRRLDEQSSEIKEIKTSLVGNSEFKQPGIVDRVEDLESVRGMQDGKIERNARAVAIGAGSLGLIGFAIAILKYFKS